ncbi:hypothetical protein K461DRAFT_154020 [Myriangium duriaei CBS 260.36]|uniref:Uncharacterized protein n=1 Tax=Myriangium duriaei CBS 260.36 TaxID=1168546 RepID=A0A9P4MLC3_9PEZI|nr:hypothetical protein K461DRAFT_154020 [Myriangium duriaei CBS 260.36]
MMGGDGERRRCEGKGKDEERSRSRGNCELVEKGQNAPASHTIYCLSEDVAKREGRSPHWGTGSTSKLSQGPSFLPRQSAAPSQTQIIGARMIGCAVTPRTRRRERGPTWWGLSWLWLRQYCVGPFHLGHTVGAVAWLLLDKSSRFLAVGDFASGCRHEGLPKFCKDRRVTMVSRMTYIDLARHGSTWPDMWSADMPPPFLGCVGRSADHRRARVGYPAKSSLEPRPPVAFCPHILASRSTTNWFTCNFLTRAGPPMGSTKKTRSLGDFSLAISN